MSTLFGSHRLTAAERKGRQYTALAQRDYPGTGQQLKLDDITIHWTEQGQGRPVILVHGLGASVMRWVPTMESLSSDYHVLAYDHPGFGKSDKPNRNYSVPFYADCLQQFIKRLDLKDPMIIGHSLGGATVLQHLLQYPGVAAQAAVVSPAAIHRPHNWLERSFAKILLKTPFVTGLFEQGLSRCVVQRTEWVLDMLFHAEGLRTDPEWDQLRLSITSVAQHLLGFSLAEDLDRIKTPLLIVWGEADALQPANLALAMHQALPLARLAIMPECGHYPMLELPDEFNRCLRDFLQGKKYIHGCEH